MAEGPITITLKGGRDYDAPWLVVSDISFHGLEKLFKGSPFEEAYESAKQALIEGNKLSAVKTVLGATEEGVTSPSHPAPPVQPEAVSTALASAAQIAVAAKKTGKSPAELEGKTADEIKNLIKEAK